MGETPTHFNAIDGKRSDVVESLAALRAGRFDSEDVVKAKQVKCQRSAEQGYCRADLQLEPGKQTLFVNAAIEGVEEGEQQLPWIVDIELSRLKADNVS